MPDVKPDWPRPPRHVPWRIALQNWALLGATAAVLLFTGIVALGGLWAADGFRSPRDDWRLDAAERVAVAAGRVTGIDREYSRKQQRVVGARVHYTFAPGTGAGELQGSSWTARIGTDVGGEVQVEYLAQEPAVNRVVGAHATKLALELPAFGGLLVLPSLFLGLLYFARVYRMRTVIRHGRATTAVLIGLPSRPAPDGKRRRRRRSNGYRLRYRYRGNDGMDHEGRQHVRYHSALDRAVLETDDGAPFAAAFVVHDENRPGVARLVATADVTEAPA